MGMHIFGEAMPRSLRRALAFLCGKPAKLLLCAWCAVALGQTASAPLASLNAIESLTPEQASHGIAVSFEATVVYYRSYEKTLYVQDGTFGILVQPDTAYQLVPGDRVLIKGATRRTFGLSIASESITVLQHGPVPPPVPASFDQLTHGDLDGRLVTVYANVHSADTVVTSGVRSTLLQMHTDGGEIDALVDTDSPLALSRLLDADVAVTGAVSGRFDGKMQQTGILLHVSSLANVKVLKPAPLDPWTLPLTPMDSALQAYHIRNVSRRIRVRGTVTYFESGAAIVLQNGNQSLWVSTLSTEPIRIGETVDAIGFPDIQNSMLSLTSAQLKVINEADPIAPQSATWEQLSSGKHVYDLVSIQGKVVAQVRGVDKDEYVLAVGDNLFSAIYRYPSSGADRSSEPIKNLREGATVRVTGICIINSPNSFDAHSSFNILLRTADDLAVVGKAPLLSIANLSKLVSFLAVLVLGVAMWGAMLRRRVRKQTASITARAEAEAQEERRNMQLEQWRSRILEDINSSRPLGELIDHICSMVSFTLHGAPCWCEIAEQTNLGQRPETIDKLRILSHDIAARSGGVLGAIHAGLNPKTNATEDEAVALANGARLAMLAVETRKLYSDLLYRSEYDLLTDAYNRFSLQRQLEQLIAGSDGKGKIFGLIYIDLDEFKQINDIYGHHVGDLYLQEVAMRMRRQLRNGDMLARLGGDEFAALVPVVRNLAQIEEIATRMERCFDAPFDMEGHIFRGAASVGFALYPLNGTTAEELLKAADSAMYAAKNARRDARGTNPSTRTGTLGLPFEK
jgi:diguanylate cyclase (GGDEF)-like protein